MYQFTVKAFKDLTVDELYAILQLRETILWLNKTVFIMILMALINIVFICFSMEPETQKIMAYARLVPADMKFDVPSIGRVICDINYRGKSLGKALMVKAIEETLQLFDTKTIKISAQTYLLKFYSGLGFTGISACYDEDGIEHVDMIYTTD